MVAAELAWLKRVYKRVEVKPSGKIMIRVIALASMLAFPVYAVEKIQVSSGNTQTAVVELYTSEGCSSCPPADKFLSSLSRSGREDLDLLALSFHVDYWDYIGWKDRFASPAYTSRQRALGANNLQRTIYTPEFFVNGMEARGSNGILDKIQQANRQTAPLQLELSVFRVGDSLLLELHSPPGREITGPVHHRYLVYENRLSTVVKRGENSGKTLKHEQVVRYMSRPENLQTDNRYQIRIDPDWQPQNIGVAVLVTSPGDSHYLQAVYTPVAALLSQ